MSIAAEGTADFAIGAGKLAAAAKLGAVAASSEEAPPVSLAASFGAAYSAVGGSVQIIQGAVIWAGLLSGHPEEAKDVADFMGAASTLSGITTLAVTGDASLAGHVGALEGLSWAAAQRNMFESMHDFGDAVLSGKDLVTSGSGSACHADVCTGTSSGVTGP